MQTVKTYYDGTTLFLIETADIPGGKAVSLTVNGEETINPQIAGKLAQIAVINGNLERLNKTDPLPSGLMKFWPNG
jgi:hypothetical protein